MKYFSFKNRIASAYIVTTAILIGAIFATIFMVVRVNVFKHLDDELSHEVARHSEALIVKDGVVALKNHEEWMEREHNTVGVDPVFIEFMDAEGNLIDKSPNLKNEYLNLSPAHADNEFYEAKLSDKRIRQTQIPILDEDKDLAGYLLIAVSLEGRMAVLDTFRNIILVTYPLVLIALFFIARIIAGRSINPINDIIETSNKITSDNLTSRIPLPENKDELYVLSQTINSLLDRVEQVIEREKLFSSYASHEFRTPLAVMKGTLEVLIRKPRSEEEYKEKVNYCIKEIDRLNSLVNQLLILTRYENQKKSLNIESINLKQAFDSIRERLVNNVIQKDIEVVNHLSGHLSINTDPYLFYTIANNLLSNAVKYSNENGKVEIRAEQNLDSINIYIRDFGIGISLKDLDMIFDDFYRSSDNVDTDIKGFGLGLSIVKRFCQILNIKINIESQLEKGTTVLLSIKDFAS